MILWNKVKERGNWLARKIRKGICFQGCDLWWTLQTLKDGAPGFINYDVQDKLNQLIMTIPFEKIHFICHSWGNWIGLRYIITHPEKEFNLISLGNPLFYGSGSFKDWGDPTLIPNIKKWRNIGFANDPISTMSSDNPNPKWRGKVDDQIVSSWEMLPIKSHCAYFRNEKVRALIVESLTKY